MTGAHPLELEQGQVKRHQEVQQAGGGGEHTFETAKAKGYVTLERKDANASEALQASKRHREHKPLRLGSISSRYGLSHHLPVENLKLQGCQGFFGLFYIGPYSICLLSLKAMQWQD